MKTLLLFLVCLFMFQVLLFASAATEAKRLLTLESWRQSNCGAGMKEGLGGRRPPAPRRRPPPPPPPSYSPGPIPKMKSPPSPRLIRSSSGSTDTSTYPRRSSLPPLPFVATSQHPPTLDQDFVHDKSPPNPYAASA